MTEATITGNQTRSDDFDASEIPAPCGEGPFLATPSAQRKDSKKGADMVEVKWKLEESVDGANDKDVSKKLSDYLLFAEKDDPWAHLHVARIKNFCTAFKLSTKGSKAEFVEAINALGQCKIWVKLETNKDTGEIQARVAYKDPKGLPGSGAAEEGDAEVSNGNGHGKKRGRR